jgi:D-sedoheptulose 7-phosphate isomerase
MNPQPNRAAVKVPLLILEEKIRPHYFACLRLWRWWLRIENFAPNRYTARMDVQAAADTIDTLILRFPALRPLREEITAAANMLIAAYYSGNKLLVCGNGGSAADAEHITGELMKSFAKKRPIGPELDAALRTFGADGCRAADNLQKCYPAIALTGALSLSTAFANDVEPRLVFAQQVLGYGAAGDVLMGISTSGNSANVLYAAITAKAKGMRVIGLTGKDGGKLKPLCDTCLAAPETETYKIQELHLPLYHALCLTVEQAVF